MDRNLGALSIDHRQVSTRGLYYQWGRKDPFPYPSDITSHEPLTGSYQNGFTNTTLARKMTVSYTIEHPTTYLDAGADWLLSVAVNPNLWGNTSSKTTLTDTGEKSIYDPCPPGWRVPDRRAWAKAALKIKASDATYYFYVIPEAKPKYYIPCRVSFPAAITRTSHRGDIRGRMPRPQTAPQRSCCMAEPCIRPKT